MTLKQESLLNLLVTLIERYEDDNAPILAGKPLDILIPLTAIVRTVFESEAENLDVSLALNL